MRSRSWLAPVLLALLAVGGWAGCSQEKTRVVVAAGTTLVDGRLLEKVASEFEDRHPRVELSVVGHSHCPGTGIGEGGIGPM